jgi:hypothetical protein
MVSPDNIRSVGMLKFAGISRFSFLNFTKQNLSILFLLPAEITAILSLLNCFMTRFVFLNERFDVISVDQHLPTDLNIRKLAVPDLGPPEPFGRADFVHKFFD